MVRLLHFRRVSEGAMSCRGVPRCAKIISRALLSPVRRITPAGYCFLYDAGQQCKGQSVCRRCWRCGTGDRQSPARRWLRGHVTHARRVPRGHLGGRARVSCAQDKQATVSTPPPHDPPTQPKKYFVLIQCSWPLLDFWAADARSEGFPENGRQIDRRKRADVHGCVCRHVS